MKKQILFTVILFVCIPVFAKLQATFLNIGQPYHLVVCDDGIYISDKSAIAVYSTKDYKFIKRVGRSGEGPGEFMSIPAMIKQRDFLSVTCLGKYLIFSLDGRLIKEQRSPHPMTQQCQTVGHNIVGVSMKAGKKDAEIAIMLYDSDFKVVKTLGTQKINLGKGPNEAFWDYFRPIVYNDRIYVGDTRRGFYIQVFDREGKLLYEIDKKKELLEVTDAYKKKFLEKMKKSSIERTIAASAGGKMKYHFRKYFPGFNDLKITDNKIYAFTYRRKNNFKKQEILIMDLKGNILKRVYITKISSKLYTIANDKYYYLEDNLSKESWELFAEPL
ncbi:MAG: 6-bladed beta-propeller [bacterium]|nr:6-bladed beta-propeller [bacterium]